MTDLLGAILGHSEPRPKSEKVRKISDKNWLDKMAHGYMALYCEETDEAKVGSQIVDGDSLRAAEEKGWIKESHTCCAGRAQWRITLLGKVHFRGRREVAKEEATELALHQRPRRTRRSRS